MSYYRCKRCGCRLDPGEGKIYPGTGLVCDECKEYLDISMEYRRQHVLTAEQMEELEGAIGEVLAEAGA